MERGAYIEAALPFTSCILYGSSKRQRVEEPSRVGVLGVWYWKLCYSTFPALLSTGSCPSVKRQELALSGRRHGGSEQGGGGGEKDRGWRRRHRRPESRRRRTLRPTVQRCIHRLKYKLSFYFITSPYLSSVACRSRIQHITCVRGASILWCMKLLTYPPPQINYSICGFR